MLAPMPDLPTPQADLRAMVREVLGGAQSGGSDGLGWMDAAEPDTLKVASGWARPGAKPRAEAQAVEEARHIQQLLLPAPPRMPGLTCATRFEPHHDVSGDFYDFLPLGPGRVPAGSPAAPPRCRPCWR